MSIRVQGAARYELREGSPGGERYVESFDGRDAALTARDLANGHARLRRQPAVFFVIDLDNDLEPPYRGEEWTEDEEAEQMRTAAMGACP